MKIFRKLCFVQLYWVKFTCTNIMLWEIRSGATKLMECYVNLVPVHVYVVHELPVHLFCPVQYLYKYEMF